MTTIDSDDHIWATITPERIRLAMEEAEKRGAAWALRKSGASWGWWRGNVPDDDWCAIMEVAGLDADGIAEGGDELSVEQRAELSKVFKNAFATRWAEMRAPVTR